MKKKDIFLTSEGFLELENELHYLKNEKRKEITKALGEIYGEVWYKISVEYPIIKEYEFETGKVYAIKGRSGTGKTTLLSLMSGLERPTIGKIIYNEKDLSKMNLDKYRNSEIGIVFQGYNLLPHLTASENIILSMDIAKMKVKNKKQLAITLMNKVGLKESYASRKVLKLSGGEQQRVAIARSLSYDPKLILADEPTGNLDKETENEIMQIFKDLAHNENKCVIIVTHSSNICEQVDIIYELQKINNISDKKSEEIILENKKTTKLIHDNNKENKQNDLSYNKINLTRKKQSNKRKSRKK